MDSFFNPLSRITYSKSQIDIFVIDIIHTVYTSPIDNLIYTEPWIE